MSQEIQRAPEGTCQYLTREEYPGKLTECGQPAAWQGRKNGKLRYCDTHGRFVGQQMEVIALKAGPDGRRETLKPWKEWMRS